MDIQDKFGQLYSLLQQDLSVRLHRNCMEQLSWAIFLKFLDFYEAKQETEARSKGQVYHYILDKPYRWSTWACPAKSANSAQMQGRMTGDSLINFVNDRLLPYLQNFAKSLDSTHDISKRNMTYFVGCIFKNVKNRVTYGTDLRKILNFVDKIDFANKSKLQEFSEGFENLIIKAHDYWGGWELFTPRPLVRTIVNTIKPQCGETIYDAAAGTCGFLTESFNYLKSLNKKYTPEQWDFIQNDTFFGIDSSSYVFLLGTVNMLLHGFESLNLSRGSIIQYEHQSERRAQFDIVLANMPYGREIKTEYLKNFPIKHQSIELLYLQHVMKSLKPNGRAAVIVPLGMLRRALQAHILLRKKLLEEFNLHTILSLPLRIFHQHADVKSCVLFFDRSGKSSDIWYYNCDFAPNHSAPEAVSDSQFKEFSKLQLKREPTERSWIVPVSAINMNYDLLPDDPKSKDETQPTYDDKKVAEFMNVQLDLVKQTLTARIDKWFAAIPDHRLMENVVTMTTGEQIPGDSELQDNETGHPYLQIADFDDLGRINIAGIKYLDDHSYSQMNGEKLLENDLCIGIGETSVKTCIVPPELSGGNLTEHAAILRIKKQNELNARYLLLYTLTAVFDRQSGRGEIGWAQPILSLDVLSRVFVPICPIELQLELTNQVWKIIDKIRSLEAEAEKLQHDDEQGIEDFGNQIEHIIGQIKKIQIPSNSVNTRTIPPVGQEFNLELSVKTGLLLLMMLEKPVPEFQNKTIKKLRFDAKDEGISSNKVIAHLENSNVIAQTRVFSQILDPVDFAESDTPLMHPICTAWQDFHAKEFNKGTDAIALFTNSLNKAELENIQNLLTLAKRHEKVEEYVNELHKVSPNSENSDGFLNEVRNHLKNTGISADASDKALFEFFKHLHIIEYDRGWQSGLVRPTLNSRVKEGVNQNLVWNELEEFVMSAYHAEAITNDNISDSIRSKFKEIPDRKPNGAVQPITPKTSEWANDEIENLLPLLILVGAWNENNQHDLKALYDFTGLNRKSWTSAIRKLTELANSPVLINNGIWEISSKKELFAQVGHKIGRKKLKLFKSIALRVLGERDSTIGVLPSHQSHKNNQNNVPLFSGNLRRGIAEGLAILGNYSKPTKNSNDSEFKQFPQLIVKELLEDVDWKLWASLNRLLPNIAEAAPVEFLDQVISALKNEDSPFERIFELDSKNILFERRITGILWALECLAWSEAHLPTVCTCLAGLAELSSASEMNSPIESLTNILLPWSPKTCATLEDRIVVINQLVVRYNNVGWKILINFLPSQTTISDGTNKPMWMRIDLEKSQENITSQDYWKQIDLIANLAVTQAEATIGRTVELIGIIECLPHSAYQRFLTGLAKCKTSSNLSEGVQEIWENLQMCIARHRQFPDAEWSLSDEHLKELEVIAESLQPNDPFTFNLHLFSVDDFKLYKNVGTWEEQEEELNTRRNNAVTDLFNRYGIKRVFEFKDHVENPEQVGIALASVENDEIDKEVITTCLSDTDDNDSVFAAAFIRERQYRKGWEWVDRVVESPWFNADIVEFFSYLPFERNNWKKACLLKKGNERDYWQNISAKMNRSNYSDFNEAIVNFIKYNRPKAAIQCLEKMKRNKKAIKSELCVQALLAATDSSEPEPPLYQFGVTELIKHLQADTTVKKDNLFEIEWAYFELLDEHNNTNPKALNEKLSTDPKFFCRVIGMAYKSTLNDQKHEYVQENAIKGYKLLRNWTILPGKTLNGGFDPVKFKNWFKQVRATCKKSGHLEVALYNIGKMLAKVFDENNGTPYNQSIANILENETVDDLLAGFRNGITGVAELHFVDPADQTDLILTKEYLKKANEIKKKGFPKLADTYIRISKDLKQQAKMTFHVHNNYSG